MAGPRAAFDDYWWSLSGERIVFTTIGLNWSPFVVKIMCCLATTRTQPAYVGHSDPVVPVWKGYRSPDKRYAGDNRLIFLESPYWRNWLAPRCRLVKARSRKRLQEFGWSPIKMVRELGLERCETVRSLSTVGNLNIRSLILSTRGPGKTDHGWTTYSIYLEYRWVAKSGQANYW
jgi:hypothetical protein